MKSNSIFSLVFKIRIIYCHTKTINTIHQKNSYLNYLCKYEGKEGGRNEHLKKSRCLMYQIFQVHGREFNGVTYKIRWSSSFESVFFFYAKIKIIIICYNMITQLHTWPHNIWTIHTLYPRPNHVECHPNKYHPKDIPSPNLVGTKSIINEDESQIYVPKFSSAWSTIHWHHIVYIGPGGSDKLKKFIYIKSLAQHG